MSLLNPFLLLGIFAVSIPIIIHLLNRRKFDRVVWAAMRFLRVSVQKNQRRLRIEDLLLLALRCLMLALLAVCLARPAIHNAGASIFGQAKTTAVMVLDNSYSMSQNNGVSSRFEHGKDALEQSIDALPSGSSVAIILASNISDQVIPEPTFDLALARKTIHDAKLCDRPTNLLRAFTDSIDILKKDGAIRKEIYLATDGQASGFQQLGEICHALDDAGDQVHAHILLCGQQETQNLGVSDLKISSDIPAVGVLHAFDVQVTNFGKNPVEGVRVQLHMDDQPPSAEAIIAGIPPGEARTITLSAKIPGEGYHTVTAAIPTDRMPADDSRTVAVNGISHVSMLLVDGNPGAEARESEVFYLRHALVPAPRGQEDQYLVQATTILSADLEGQKLDHYQIVALADVSELSDKTLENLSAFVHGGGGLLVFPGENTSLAFYNQKMLGKYDLLPASLGAATGDSAQQAHFIRLAGHSLDHPIVSLWSDPASGNLADAHFYKRYPLKPVADKARVVLRFSDESPYMIERPLGQGRVILFASTAGTRWNDLPDHPGIYVPLMYRTLGWILLDRDRALNIAVGDKFVFHPPVQMLGQEAVITRPGADGNALRDSRRVEMDDHQTPTLTYDDTGLAGEYDAQFGNDKPVRFAAQSDKDESSLDDITEAQRRQLAGSAVVLDWKPGLDLKELLDKERVGAELWLPIAMIVLILATSETFLADWFSKPK